MSSKARRPYLMGKSSVREFYSAPTRFLKEIVGRESEFEKPYEDEEYRKMHFDFPWPDWPSLPNLPPLPDVPGPIGKLAYCGFVCYEPTDCAEPIWCHPGIWCGNDLMCNLCSWEVEGATVGWTPHEIFYYPWGIDVWLDSSLAEGGKAAVRVRMTDPCGNICVQDIEVNCAACPPDIAISWDDGLSAETVAQSSSAGVYVQDGVGPYTWSVSGTGFSMLHASTDVVYNNVVADGAACGTATVTVTDACEGSTTGYVRCTTGVWDISIAQCVACQPAGIGVECPATGCATCTAPGNYTENQYRWRYSTAFEYYAGYPGCPPIWRNPPVTNCPGAVCSEPDPPCGTPVQCAGGTPCVGGRTCYVSGFDKDEWVCA